ncbi:MAG TPA: dynamin family protein, partial [Candidatus Methylomirabilis sp.]|nr:dynamin family protein [Candidatus Methylomirabilis sp.]
MTTRLGGETVSDALNLVGALCRRYQLSALEKFLESCRNFAGEETLNIAILGRFKAGKSSFLNHLLGQPVLPVGVIPVTTVVTEIQHGPKEQAEIGFRDGRTEFIPVHRLGEFIAEAENPGNAKQVQRVRVALPAMERYPGLCFVDTPGLESVLAHNTDAALEWLPNVGLAVVAVGVDPPLSQHDLELIRALSRYTPHIALLLTKVDVLTEAERVEVAAFVRQQLERDGGGRVRVFPYS